MEADITMCAAVLQLLCDGFGKDDPVSRRDACLALCGSLESYDRAIERLAAQSTGHRLRSKSYYRQKNAFPRAPLRNG